MIMIIIIHISIIVVDDEYTEYTMKKYEAKEKKQIEINNFLDIVLLQKAAAESWTDNKQMYQQDSNSNQQNRKKNRKFSMTKR